MKKSKKIISAVLTPMACVPLASISLVGCSDNYSKIVETLYNDFEKEFDVVCEIKRPTFENKVFCDFMIDHIQDLGIKPEWIVTDENSYHPIDPVTEEEYPNHGYNFYYDIPATKGYENSNGIILQCHTDMVWVTNPDPGIYVPDHPIPIREKDEDGNLVIHTWNYSSSLGADDGAGIATCLAITKNANEFAHGPIRILMTTDEEDGPSGASYIPESWLKSSGNFKSKYLLNIDLEEANKVCQSTAGVQQGSWKKTFNVITDSASICDYGIILKISGLAGGHSAQVIKKGNLNAIKLATNILSDLNEKQKAEKSKVTFQLFRAFENQADEAVSTPGTVPNQIEICFATDYADATTLKPIIEEIARKYRDGVDKDFDIMVDTFDHMEDFSKGVIATEDSCNIIKLFNKLPYEVSQWLDPETRTSPATSCNIGAFRIRDKKYASGTGEVYLEIFGRSCYKEVLGPKPEPNADVDTFLTMYSKLSREVFGNDKDGSWDWTIGWNPCWQTKPEDKLPNLIMNGIHHFGGQGEYLNEHSWLEIGEFASKTHNELDISAIGPTIKHVHNIMETLYLDTVPTMFKILVYVLDKIKEERSLK